MSRPDTILITSASGNIGRTLVPLLQSQDPRPKLILPTSSTTKLQSAIPSLPPLNSVSNIHIAEGSIKDPVWFQSLLTTHDVDTVFLNLTGTDELFTVLNCIDAISRVTTIKRLIYLSVIGDFTSQAGFVDAVRNRGYPHVFAKVLVEQRLKYGNFSFQWTVLGPTLFFSNDEMQKSNLLGNSFLGSPLSTVGVNKVSLSDIAIAIRNTMYNSTGTWTGKKVQLGSKKTYTGSEILELWSRALNKPLEGLFASSENMERWEQQSRKFMLGDYGNAWARDLRILFEFLMDNGMSMSSEEYRDQVTLLGKEPDDYETWVRQKAQEWLKE